MKFRGIKVKTSSFPLAVFIKPKSGTSVIVVVCDTGTCLQACVRDGVEIVTWADFQPWIFFFF